MATDTLPTEQAVPGLAAPAAPPFAPPWLAAALGLTVLLAFVPLLQVHARSLWDRSHYQFFPLAVVGAGVLAWSRWRTVATASLAPASSGVTLGGLAVLAWVLLAVAEVLYSPVLAGMALLVLLAALILGVGGRPLFRALLPAWGFLWITIPPPFGLDRQLVLGLQALTSRWSSAILDALGVLHLPDGNVVQISGRRLLVEEACAGISSLFSVLACALFLILWLRRRWLRSALLLTSAVVWVLVCNVLRVVAIAWAFDRGALDLSVGVKHDLLGFGCFALAVLLISSTDRLLLFLVPGAAAPPAPLPSAPAPAGPALLPAAARLLSWPMAVAFGLLFLFHAATYGLTPDGGPGDLLAGIARLNEDSLPPDLAGWKRVNFEKQARELGSAYGEHSRVWQFKLGQQTALVALDYPFAKYHILNECYVNQGWEIEKASNRQAETPGTGPDHRVELKLKKAALRSGWLVYTEFDQGGNVLEPPGGLLRTTWKRYETALASWRQRLSRPDQPDRRQSGGPVYQFQVFVAGNRPLTAEEQEVVHHLFVAAHAKLHAELFPPK